MDANVALLFLWVCVENEACGNNGSFFLNTVENEAKKFSFCLSELSLLFGSFKLKKRCSGEKNEMKTSEISVILISTMTLHKDHQRTLNEEKTKKNPHP